MKPNMLYAIALVALLLSFPFSFTAFADNAQTCQVKTLDTGTVTGQYLGFFPDETGDLPDAIRIKIDDGTEMSFFAYEEDAKKFFGNTVGQQVAVNYTLEQFLHPDGEYCIRDNVLKDGYVMPNTQALEPGTFTLVEEGAEGELILVGEPMTHYEVDIETVNTARMNTCSFNGECLAIEGKLACPVVIDDHDEAGASVERITNLVILVKDGNTIEVTDAPNGSFCGMGASLYGTYKRK